MLGAPSPAGAQEPEFSVRARQHLLLGSEASPTERQRLLDDGERLLAAGDVTGAQAAFERAALMMHAPDTEAALVRSHLQAGDYRRALAFGAHAAQAHLRQWPAGMALYAWLLRIGDQTAVAQHLLARALADYPDEPLLRATAEHLAQPWPRPGPALLQPPLRLAPAGWGNVPPAGAWVAGTAVLLEDGQSALLPASVLAALPEGATLWLRNGMGQTVGAHRDPTTPAAALALGLARLRLDTSLPPPRWQVAAREPFGGSPCATVEYAEDPTAEPAWPLLRAGFMGRVAMDPSQPRRLDIPVPPGPRGGPVIDAAGQWAGIALPLGVDTRVVGPGALVAAGLIPTPQAVGTSSAELPPRVALDEAYERALGATLQVIATH